MANGSALQALLAQLQLGQVGPGSPIGNRFSVGGQIVGADGQPIPEPQPSFPGAFGPGPGIAAAGRGISDLVARLEPALGGDITEDVRRRRGESVVQALEAARPQIAEALALAEGIQSGELPLSTPAPSERPVPLEELSTRGQRNRVLGDQASALRQQIIGGPAATAEIPPAMTREEALRAFEAQQPQPEPAAPQAQPPQPGTAAAGIEARVAPPPEGETLDDRVKALQVGALLGGAFNTGLTGAEIASGLRRTNQQNPALGLIGAELNVARNQQLSQQAAASDPANDPGSLVSQFAQTLVEEALGRPADGLTAAEAKELLPAVRTVVDKRQQELDRIDQQEREAAKAATAAAKEGKLSDKFVSGFEELNQAIANLDQLGEEFVGVETGPVASLLDSVRRTVGFKTEKGPERDALNSQNQVAMVRFAKAVFRERLTDRDMAIIREAWPQIGDQEENVRAKIRRLKEVAVNEQNRRLGTQKAIGKDVSGLESRGQIQVRDRKSGRTTFVPGSQRAEFEADDDFEVLQ